MVSVFFQNKFINILYLIFLFIHPTTVSGTKSGTWARVRVWIMTAVQLQWEQPLIPALSDYTEIRGKEMNCHMFVRGSCKNLSDLIMNCCDSAVLVWWK